MPGNPSPGAWGKDNSDSQGGIDTVRVKFTAGTAGAVPTFPLSMSNDVISVTKSNTTGQYDIVFSKAQNQSAGFYGDVLQATPATTTAAAVKKVAEDSAAGTCTVEFYRQDTGAATYLTSGDIATLVFSRQRYKSQ